MTKNEMLDLLQRVKIRWPNFQIHDDLDLMVEVYMEDLGDFDYEKVKAAYKSFKDSRFAPTLSEVVAVLAPDDALLGEPWMRRGPESMGFFTKPEAGVQG